MITNRRLQLLTVLFFLSIGTSFAKEKTEPFSRTHLSFKGLTNINENEFHDYWEGSIGGSFQFEMSFYFSDALFGYQRMSFAGDNNLQPDFKSSFSYFALGKKLHISKKLLFFASGGFGNFKMDGDPSNLQGPAGDEDVFLETEFAYILMGELRYQINPKINLTVGTQYIMIHTRKKIHLVDVHAGLGYSFDTPNWLRGILQ